MAAPNIVNVSDIKGKTAVGSLTTTLSSYLDNASASNQVYKINSIIVANVDGTNAADVNVSVFRSSTHYYLAKTISVPADSTLIVLSKDMGIYLEEGDSIYASAGAASDLQILVSYEIIE
jgi:hypothetical protein